MDHTRGFRRRRAGRRGCFQGGAGDKSDEPGSVCRLPLGRPARAAGGSGGAEGRAQGSGGGRRAAGLLRRGRGRGSGRAGAPGLELLRPLRFERKQPVRHAGAA
ncbi:MAG: hypothetical protein E8A49_06660 [Phenylobacterium sp.]|nr:MAG: hypothetical protein E8A49_06660 [Phenylobacterium sp.]